MAPANPAVDQLLMQDAWQAERQHLRSILLGCGLQERVRWGKLCYAHNGANIVIIFGMKHCCALGFFSGSLLRDSGGVLVQPGKNSQAMRQLRFDNLDQIKDREALIGEFVLQAQQVADDGRKVSFSQKHNLTIPDELRDAMDADPDLAKAFHALTPGRQRGYVLHIAQAKQPKTRAARVQKCRPKITAGRGLQDR